MKSVLLIGTGHFGQHIATQLYQLGHHIMAVDSKEERINEVLPFVTSAQIGDSTSQEFLETLGVDNYDLCIVTIGNDFQSSLETTSLLKELGAKFVVSRAERAVQKKFLLRNGADEVVYPEQQVARWAAIRYSSDHIFDYIEIGNSHSIFEVSVPVNWQGKSIIEIDIRKKFNINIIALKLNGNLEVSFSPNTILTKEHTMLVIGEYKAIQKCFHI